MLAGGGEVTVEEGPCAQRNMAVAQVDRNESGEVAELFDFAEQVRGEVDRARAESRHAAAELHHADEPAGIAEILFAMLTHDLKTGSASRSRFRVTRM